MADRPPHPIRGGIVHVSCQGSIMAISNALLTRGGYDQPRPRSIPREVRMRALEESPRFPPQTCAVCGGLHSDQAPHHDTPYYRSQFSEQFGRDPTAEDAAAHVYGWALRYFRQHPESDTCRFFGEHQPERIAQAVRWCPAARDSLPGPPAPIRFRARRVRPSRLRRPRRP